jgi:hypothetical protein
MKFQKAMKFVAAGSVLCVSFGLAPRQEKAHPKNTSEVLTYTKDIAPIVKKYCLSCHGSDTENPSDLYMDDYATMMKGGKHGVTVIPGKPDESNLYLKLTPNPPFGKQMPRGHKKITPEAVKVIHDWIAEGAKEK